MLQPEDDLIHTVGPEPWWREAWYWGLYDRKSDLQFVCYLGVFPNQERADVIVGIYKQRQALHHHIKMDYHIARDIGEDRLGFGPVLMRTVDPMKRWELSYVAPDVGVDLTFEAVHEPYSWAESKLWMEKEGSGARSNHFDQIGRFRGELRHAGTSTLIDCLGYRDRMWGWGGRSKWKQYVMFWPVFDENFTVNVYPQGFTDGREQLCGYIFRNGDRDLLKRSQMTVHWGERGRMITSVNAVIESQRGEKLTVDVEPLNIVDTSGWWPHRVGHLLFGTARYHCDGRAGYGDFAYYYQTEASRPTVWDCQGGG